MTDSALVLHPDILRPGHPPGLRAPEARLDEAVGLAAAIGLKVAHSEVVAVKQVRPATLVGGGVVERFQETIAENDITVVVVDTALSPVQQRNLEQAWDCKVIDRTGLILEIFGARARTKEGKLQVELAALSYQRSRLVRSWTHLERQRGGVGFMGGPGESQLEIDRRLITERITRLKKELVQVQRTRGLHRGARQRVPYPVVAFVGYTNAGKSTLFNRLTEAKVLARDQLFATLDPTMRRVVLPSGQVVILSDTVGFISDLPTDLVAAFRATLEEVLEADLILHIRDAAHPDSRAQQADVQAVLADLGVSEGAEHLFEVLNKCDLLSTEEKARLALRDAEQPKAVLCSALTGEGCDQLLAMIDNELSAKRLQVALSLPLSEGAALSWLYDHGEVLQRRDDGLGCQLDLKIAQNDLQRYLKKFPEIAAKNEELLRIYGNRRQIKEKQLESG
ncbi:GTPase HflX [Pelagibius litoralis]|uniref:GTPase HflX n=1 Tax=Pelagibius litoralis TaxID=374515 RepID=A0A967C4U8_9PROT|nr:GTPase HflX [Pelagibius litoralis]NIA67361.1 GTPase HflX [Pelagibius litoralis]